MKRRRLCGVIALILTFVITSTVIASPLDDEKAKQQSNLQQNQADYEAAQKQTASLESKIQMMDSQIEKTMSDLSNIQSKIDIKTKEIAQTQVQLKKSEDDIKDEQDIFNQRMKALYVSGSDSYLSVLVQATSFSDMVQRIEIINKIADYDNKVIAGLKTKRELVNKNKADLQKQNDSLVALKNENNAKLTKLNNDKAEEAKLIAQAKQNEQVLGALVEVSQSKVNDIEKQIQAQIAAEQAAARAAAQAAAQAAAAKASNGGGGGTVAPQPTPKPVVASATAATIINYAMQFLRTPYVWGGTTPYNSATRTGGFDCSGYMQYVFAHFGISITRTTYTQINDGIEVSKNNIVPGDLVFFGDYGEPHHVGMYIGEGLYIHAPKTGDVIKISAMAGRSDFCRARRILR